MLKAGTGPVAVDAERASGHRYGQRAFLIQINRKAAGTWLIDPEAFDGLKIINDALAGVEWILHAAIQDLPSLYEQQLWPDQLFDTELAGRLCSFPKVGLSSLLERQLGITLAKEHSAADWSQRPLPKDMRSYAALDVEFLFELRDSMEDELRAQDKLDIAYQEFEALRTKPLPAPRKDPWRRTSGIHKIRSRETLALVRSLWLTREKIAKAKDISPGRLINDAAIIAAAEAAPKTVPELLKIPRFNGRAAAKEAPKWIRAIQDGRKAAQDPSQLPSLKVPSQAPPPARQWKERDPVAAARFQTARSRLQRIAEERDIPMENLLLPSTLREICWRPPEPITPEAVENRLEALGARAWQIEATSAVITIAMLEPEPLGHSPHHENQQAQGKKS